MTFCGARDGPRRHCNAAKVETRLREQGISRYDLGRESLFNKYGTGKMNMPTSSTNSGLRWESQLTTIVNALPLTRA